MAPRIKGLEKTAAELCGNLPLAVQVLAGTVNSMTLFAVSALLAQVQRHPEVLDKVRATLQTSHDLLEDEVREYWKSLCVFPGSFDLDAAASFLKVSDSVGPEALGRPSGSDSTNHGHGQIREKAREKMQILLNANVVERNVESGRFRLHDLVRSFCNGKISVEQRHAAMLQYSKYYCEVIRSAEKLCAQGGDALLQGLRLFDDERTNVDLMFKWLREPHGCFLDSRRTSDCLSQHM